MKTAQTDLFNTLAIVISLTLAFSIPFELFLFSYAILGPLHYLTEINWLEKNDYFIPHKKIIYAFYLIAFLLSIPAFFHIFQSYFELGNDTQAWIRKFGKNLGLYGLLFILFFAFSLTLFRSIKKITVFNLFLVLPLIILLPQFNFISTIVIYFLPTLIHVYVFTALFMLAGYFKNNSQLGLLNILLLGSVPVLISLSRVIPQEYIPSFYTQQSMQASNMLQLNAKIFNLFSNDKNVFTPLAPLALKIQIFVAFAYTYHYLNWFAKTSVIGWYKIINTKKWMIIVSLWIISIIIYAVDFKTGIHVLFFMSMLHVILEFPLNFKIVNDLIQSKFLRK